MAEDNKNIVVEDTPAAMSIRTKTGAMADFISMMQGMSHDDITKLADQFAVVQKNTSAAPDNSAKNKASIAMKEDIALIFGEDNQQLSEEFLERTTTLFEAAVTVKVAELREEIYQEAAEIVEEEVEDAIEALTENLEEYIDYAVSEWINENQLAIENGIKFNQYESFFENVYNVFLEHNVDIPEEEESVVEALTDEIDELKAQLNEQVIKNIENQKIIDEARKEQIFDEISEGLAATQVEKLRSLSEDLDYNDLELYRKKVNTLKEHHFKSDRVSTQIVEDTSSSKNEKTAPVAAGIMSKYAAAIEQQVKY